MAIALKSAAGGTISIDAENTSNNNLITFAANTVMLVTQSSNTGAINIPLGTSSQRPNTSVGLLRFNSSLGTLEYSDGALWYSI